MHKYREKTLCKLPIDFPRKKWYNIILRQIPREALDLARAAPIPLLYHIPALFVNRQFAQSFHVEIVQIAQNRFRLIIQSKMHKTLVGALCILYIMNAELKARF